MVLNVTLKFGGGAEGLFGGQKKIKVNLDEDHQENWTMRSLLVYIKDNLVLQAEEKFFQNGTVRPGILVFVNDCDWELLYKEEYEIEQGDVITFTSTLHGG